MTDVRRLDFTITDAQLERFAELDTTMAKACDSIRVLTYLTWPESLMDTFLESYEAGN